jgi:hypothetical protein
MVGGRLSPIRGFAMSLPLYFDYPDNWPVHNLTRCSLVHSLRDNPMAAARAFTTMITQDDFETIYEAVSE